MDLSKVSFSNLRFTRNTEKPKLCTEVGSSKTHFLIEQTLVFRATTTYLPLTFFDLHFVGPVYVKCIFFDPFTYSTNHFCKTTLPSLKKISFSYCSTFLPFSLQVTVFPDHGICIGITYCHMMDDNSCNHFMKSWSFIHQGGNGPKGLENIFFSDYFAMRKSWKNRLIAETEITKEHEDFVKAIIVFGKEEIEGMKKYVLNQWKKNGNNKEINVPQFLSHFVVTCAFAWVSIYS
ncbi:transferase family protein [Medicago truncatula]|uniref:Transferase family protein n=1 Tax=Medicago truncatula TaxID=3880 RepID=G7JN63_MEDTR|nr:transferase family protein [Medicago truncatula]